MSKIQLLDNSLINKIAAGEVVERPASVVKELVENAIDAGATKVAVEIKEGGILSIRITDNGRGIESEQVKSAFLRHETRKILTLEVLEGVLTLGFRGEALSSISSVSQVEMFTKTAFEPSGTRIELDGGNVVSFGAVGCVEGTTIIVKNLFFNTPARKKFLKKAAVEGGYITDIMNKLALGRPDVEFTYISNGKEALRTKGNNDLKAVITQIYGKEVGGNLLLVEAQQHGLQLNGYIGKPEIYRANRTHENTFLNSRYIKCDIVRSACEEAFWQRIPLSKFPFFVLNLQVDPRWVDVNVHPTKLEVRFAEESEIFEFVKNAVHNVLNEASLIPKARFSPLNNALTENKEQKKEWQEIKLDGDYSYTLTESKDNGHKTAKTSEYNNYEKPKVITLKEEAPNNFSREHNAIEKSEVVAPKSEAIRDIFKQEVTVTPIAPQRVTPMERSAVFENHKIIGQIFNTYWIVEAGYSIFMIDQHAAHEKVLYEDLFNRLRQKSVSQQLLLQPTVIDVTPFERQVVLENMELLESFGFLIEEFSDKAFVLRGVPFIFEQKANAEFFMEILDRLSNINKGSIANIYETKEMTIATISCKAAVKANDSLTVEEAAQLIKKLIGLSEPFTCPHGRPTIIEITKTELEKKFKRII